MSAECPVTVSIVTYNSGRYIRRCLESVLAQNYPGLRITVVDNASADDTVSVLKEFDGRIQVIRNQRNAGFAEGQNQGIQSTDAEWVLTLNPDVMLMPGFVERLVAAGTADPSVGTVCGKLLRMSPEYEKPARPVIDSTGIYMTPAMRHLDRGNGAEDNGRYEQPEYVFGATGAAALYRQSMIADISIDGEFFDTDFFVYREDADVAWRAQLLGWRCVYTPEAVAYHVRSVTPENRGTLSAMINMHSVKNRWYLRIKNVTGDLYSRYGLAMTLRDAVVIGGCVVKEHRSLKAFPMVLRNVARMKAKRREIMSRRRATDEYLASWFSFTPVSFPLNESKAYSFEKAATR